MKNVIFYHIQMVKYLIIGHVIRMDMLHMIMMKNYMIKVFIMKKESKDMKGISKNLSNALKNQLNLKILML